jgi:transposase
MTRRPHIGIDLQSAIIKGREAGLMPAALATQFSLPASTVRGIIHRSRIRGGVVKLKNKGRARKNTIREDQLIIRISKADPRLNSVDIHREITTHNGIKVSSKTVQRRLRSAGLNGCRPAKKPFISVKNRAARLAFARKHLTWTVIDWQKVIFSDESKFVLFGSDGIKYIRRPEGKRHDHRYQLPTIKHGGGCVMVWGCFRLGQIGPLHLIDGIMDKLVYRAIMNDVLLPHVREGAPQGWVFQQDNDPKHTSGIVRDFFKAEKIRLLDWPSQSPDLNPIEHLWDELERRCRGLKARNKAEKFEQLTQ